MSWEEHRTKNLDEILQMIGSMAAQDFNVSLNANYDDEQLNAISEGLNWLCEELEANTVEKSLYTAKNLELEQALREITDYKTAIDAAAIVLLSDTKGNIKYANENFSKRTGYALRELIDKNESILDSGHHPQSFWDEMNATLERGEIWRREVKNKAKDGSFYWVDVTIVPFFDSNNEPYQYLSIRKDITNQKQHDESLMHSIFNSQEKDREYFAEDLHEGLAQTLAGLTFQIQALESRIQELKDPELLESVSSIKEYIGNSVNNTRKLATELMPRTMMTFGLIPSVESYVSHHELKNKISLRIDPDIELIEVAKDIQISIFRAIEAIIGEVSSSNFSTLSIRLQSAPYISASVAVSFEHSILPLRPVLAGNDALTIVQKRIDLVGGHMEIQEDQSDSFALFTINFPQLRLKESQADTAKSSVA